MLTCRDAVRRYASDYIDGNLGWRERIGVRLHLMMCDNCRRFTAQLRRIPALLRHKAEISVPDDAETRALAARLADVYIAQKKLPPPL